MKYHMPLDDGHTEYIFAPFHDPEHSPWLPARIDNHAEIEVVRESLWDSTTFSWSKSSGDSSFTIYIPTPFDSHTHDQLIACLAFPESAHIEIALLRKNGEASRKWSSPVSGNGIRQEIICDVAKLNAFNFVPGRKSFSGIAIRLTSPPTDLRILSLSWLGMRNSAAYKLTSDLRAAHTPDWSPWILPQESWEDVHFERGLLFDEDALENARRKLKDDAWKQHFSILESRAKEHLKCNPEDVFGEYLPNHDSRYIRQDQHGHTAYHWDVLVLAFVGLINEDKVMIQHALRYLMCMLHTRSWTESGEHNVPSSTWSHLSFMEEMTTTSVAILADWLGFALFERTKTLIRKSLLEKGITPVLRDLSSREHMHQMNQGVVFNRAVVLGGLMLESGWTRFRPDMVDNAYSTMCDVADKYFKPDGGVHEGIAYLSQTMTAALWTTIAYCRARGMDWETEVRNKYGNIGRYVAVMSTAHPGKAIPAGDCRVDWFSGDVIPILASVFPDSPFSHILDNCLKEGWVHRLTGTLAKSGGLIGMVYGPDKVSRSRSIVPDYDFLPQSGKVTVNINGTDGLSARLWISGCAKGATHAHRDVGQFILEIEGEEILIDRGMVEYWRAEAHFLSHAWLHNVLTPVDDDGSYINQAIPTGEDLIAVSEDKCNICVPGNGVWEGYAEQYNRKFNLTSAAGFSVTDEFSLSKNCRMAFHLHSPFMFEISGKKAILEEKGFRLEIFFPWAESLCCKQALVGLEHRTVFHISAMSPMLEGDCQLETVTTITRL